MLTMTKHYLLFDVFTDTPYAGNQLAVFPEGDDLDDRSMQHIASELNLAESVFLTATGDTALPATLRIFTPRREVLFAGHPTIGSAIAIADVLRWIPATTDRFTITERIGDVSIRLEREHATTAWLVTPSLTFGSTFGRSEAMRMLGLSADAGRDDLPPQIVSAGNPFLFVALRDEAAVDAARLDIAGLQALIPDPASVIGVFLFTQRPNGTYARMFAPMAGIAEDPATGSATGPLYAYLLHYGAIANVADARYVSEQGAKMGRRSILHVRVVTSNGQQPHIEVGGRAVHIGEGHLFASIK